MSTATYSTNDVVFSFIVFGWCIPGRSGPPTWTPPPFITRGTIQRFLDVFFHIFCFSFHEASSYQVPAELTAVVWLIISSASLRSAPQRKHSSAAPWSVPCSAMRCGTVRCCAVLCRAACFTVLLRARINSIITPCPGGGQLGSSAQLSSAQRLTAALAQPAQRYAVPCGAVRCRALRCGTVPCCVLCCT